MCSGITKPIHVEELVYLEEYKEILEFVKKFSEKSQHTISEVIHRALQREHEDWVTEEQYALILQHLELH